jgi:hypothetical protein
MLDYSEGIAMLYREKARWTGGREYPKRLFVLLKVSRLGEHTGGEDSVHDVEKRE